MENDIIWREFKTKNGEKFRVGYPKEIGYTEDNIDSLLKNNIKPTNLEANWVDVNWVPKEHTSWTVPKEAVQAKGISNYKFELGGILFQCRLWFINTSGWYFNFVDDSGDEYTVSTPRNGTHYLDYNSYSPTIVKVN